MIDALKGWIITICTAIFFITAVEMILPDNNIKKYAKFVLGLILITVLIKPLIMIFDKKYDISAYADNAAVYFSKNSSSDDLKKYKNENIKSTAAAFEKNLNEVCIKYLKQEYPENEYDVMCSIAYDDTNEVMTIKRIEVYVRHGKIQPVEKVVINKKNNDENNKAADDETAKKIIALLSQKIDVSKDIIRVFKK